MKSDQFGAPTPKGAGLIWIFGYIWGFFGFMLSSFRSISHAICNILEAQGYKLHAFCNISGIQDRILCAICNILEVQGYKLHAICNISGVQDRILCAICSILEIQGCISHAICNISEVQGCNF